MSAPVRLPRPLRSTAQRAIVAVAVVLLALAAVLVTLLLSRTPSSAAPAPTHQLQMIDDECYEAGPAQPC
jgi:FlaG/FlaF family flagellin (archaellin)